MSIYNIKKSIERVIESLSKIQQEDINQKHDLRKSFFNYKERKVSYLQDSIKNNIETIKNSLPDINEALRSDKSSEIKAKKAQELVKNVNFSYEKGDFTKLKIYLDELGDIISNLNVPQTVSTFKKPKNIPEEVKSEILADINEIEKCFKFGCYRSSVIICGRILETALHRRYYEITQNDLLEKAPGIGLGKIIAKLEEENIKFDPGLTQQIHLINQMRIFSVHNKKDAFNPTETQTQAIILYTLDIIEKLFKQ